MASVIDRTGTEIELRDCSCGAEPEYHSANGLSHQVRCTACDNITFREMCGMDAVTRWNDAMRMLLDASHSIVNLHSRTFQKQQR